MTQNLISTSSSFRVTRSMDGPNWTGTDNFSKPGQDQDQELKIYIFIGLHLQSLLIHEILNMKVKS